MFTSKKYLQNNLGVDADIAAFFVDRKVPENNLYWKERLLYVAKGTGYLFIPLFFDLKYKCGVSKQYLLHEDYVQLMEEILNSAAMHEFEQISFHEHIENCRFLMSGKVKNTLLYADLLEYLSDEDLKPVKNIGTPSKALNRGDTFLFTLCFLELPDNVVNQILEEWYALVPSFLLMDDIMDLKEDRERNEENAINDFGQGANGVEKAIDYLKIKFNHLKSVNVQLSEYFERSLQQKLQSPYMQFLLKH